MSTAQDGLIFAIGWAYVLLAPYTKVEESFNLHATHDVLMYGVKSPALHNYDHFTFPGAVPRTFVGSVPLAWLSTFVIQLANWGGVLTEKANMQIIVRLVLASVNAAGLCFLRRAVSRRFGRLTGLFFTLFTCSQFHVPFWMGRTIPNMFALIPVNIAISLLVDRAPSATKPSKRSVEIAIALLTFTTVVFRAEVLLLLGPLVLQCLLLRYITVANVIKTGALAGLASIALTISVDSYFWDNFPVWPELSGLYFNVYQGKSSEWGTSPPLEYFLTHLPKLLLSSLPLALIGTTLDQRIRTLILPTLVFLGLISCIGHKEWRFIVYVVPIFNVAAARGARWMVSRRKNSLIGRLLFLFVSGLLASNILATSFLTYASIHNYPGGEALALFHRLYPSNKTQSPPHVHISNLAAQTGASLFLQTNSPPHPPPSLSVSPPQVSGWKYNKTESQTAQDLTATPSITHLISESKPDARVERDWKIVGSVKGFERWVIDWDLIKGRGKGAWLDRIWNILTMVTEEKLWILERQRSGTHYGLFLDSKFGKFAVKLNTTPKPGPGDLLVKIEATGINPTDWKIQKYGILVQNYPAIIGTDVAGIVEEVGEGVTAFAKGDRVLYQASWANDRAGYQQYGLIDASTAAKVPPNVSLEEAASIPVTIAAAVVGLYNPKPSGAGFVAPFESSNRGREAGKPILVMGGGSSIGQFVIQFARLSGFSPIITTASLKHEAYLKSLGATHVLDRHTPLSSFPDEIAKITKKPIETVYDPVSLPETQEAGYSVLAEGGLLILVLPPAVKSPVDTKRILHVFGVFTIPRTRELGVQLYSHLEALLKEGSIKPNRVEVVPGGLNGVVGGLAKLQANEVSGTKLVIRPQDTN